MAMQKSCVVFDAEKLALARKNSIEEQIRNNPLGGNFRGFFGWLI